MSVEASAKSKAGWKVVYRVEMMAVQKAGALVVASVGSRVVWTVVRLVVWKVANLVVVLVELTAGSMAESWVAWRVVRLAV